MATHKVPQIQKFIDSAGPPVQAREIEWNGIKDTFNIRRLGGAEMDGIRAGSFDTQGNPVVEMQKTYRARLVAACLSENDGQTFLPIEVGNWPDGLLTQLTKACNEVNGIETGAVKVAEKNSAKTPNAGG